MEKILKKLFGGLELSWPAVIISAVCAGVFTAVMALIPALHYTSFIAITATFEVWILFGILIIMNSRSNLDAALKCFVFFLISQPLVYLIQVPFSSMGWGLFKYYPYWFVWTVLCFPMGFVGYYMKKDKWWGYLILLPMVLLTAYSYLSYFSDFLFYCPRYILISVFCVVAMIIYPIAIFSNKKIRITGAAIGAVLAVAITVICLLRPPIYNTWIMSNGEKYSFDDSCTVYLEDKRYGKVEIEYMKSIEDFMVHAQFRRAGKTVIVIEYPDGQKKEYDIRIEKDKYEITDR